MLSPSTRSKCSLYPPPVREGFTANEVPGATIPPPLTPKVNMHAVFAVMLLTLEFLLHDQVERLLAAQFRRHLGITGALFRVRVPSCAVLWDLISVIPLFKRQQSPLPVMRARHVSNKEHDRTRRAKTSTSAQNSCQKQRVRCLCVIVRLPGVCMCLWREEEKQRERAAGGGQQHYLQLHVQAWCFRVSESNACNKS